MKRSRGLRLCIGASSGGHMAELTALLSVPQPWTQQRPSICISTLDLENAPAADRHYVIGECNRKQLSRVAGVVFRSIKILAKERPHLVVTTGSMPLALFGLLAKLFGAKLVWVDSISQISEISLSGKLVINFADLFFVQWPDLEAKYPKAIYRGELI